MIKQDEAVFDTFTNVSSDVFVLFLPFTNNITDVFSQLMYFVKKDLSVLCKCILTDVETILSLENCVGKKSFGTVGPNSNMTGIIIHSALGDIDVTWCSPEMFNKIRNLKSFV